MFEIAGGIILAGFFFFGLWVVIGVVGAIDEDMKKNAEWRRRNEVKTRKEREWRAARDARNIMLKEAMNRFTVGWDDDIEDTILGSVDFHFSQHVKALERWDVAWSGNWGVNKDREMEIGKDFWPADRSSGKDWDGVEAEANRTKDLLLTAGFEPSHAIDMIDFANFCLLMGDYDLERTAETMVKFAKTFDAYLRALRANAFGLEVV